MSDKKESPVVVDRALSGLPIDQNVDGAPIVFVDGAQGALFSPEVVKFSFFQDVAHSIATFEESPVTRRVVCRFVMTRRTLREISAWLASMVEDLDKSDKERAHRNQGGGNPGA